MRGWEGTMPEKFLPVDPSNPEEWGCIDESSEFEEDSSGEMVSYHGAHDLWLNGTCRIKRLGWKTRIVMSVLMRKIVERQRMRPRCQCGSSNVSTATMSSTKKGCWFIWCRMVGIVSKNNLKYAFVHNPETTTLYSAGENGEVDEKVQTY